MYTNSYQNQKIQTAKMKKQEYNRRYYQAKLAKQRKEKKLRKRITILAIILFIISLLLILIK